MHLGMHSEEDRDREVSEAMGNLSVNNGANACISSIRGEKKKLYKQLADIYGISFDQVVEILRVHPRGSMYNYFVCMSDLLENGWQSLFAESDTYHAGHVQ